MNLSALSAPRRWPDWLRRKVPWPIVAAGIAGVCLCFSAAWRGIELKTFDWLTIATAPNQVELPITIIAIDEESMAHIGRQWPWPRHLHAEILDRLKEAGAAVVAFDVVFAEPSAPTDDLAFARAIQNFGGVVLAADRDYRESPSGRQWLRVEPHPSLLQAGAIAGFASLDLDSDFVARRVPLNQDALWKQVVKRFDSVHPKVASRLAADENQRIRFAGKPHTFSYVSYYRLLDPKQFLTDQWREALRDNIVLVGRTLRASPEVNAAQPDLFFTPFFASSRELMPGVELHANLIANMISGDAVNEAPRPYSVLLVVAITLLAAFAMRTWHPVKGALTVTLLTASLVLLDFALFRHYETWLPAAAAVTTLLLAYAAQGAQAYLQVQERRRELRRAFTHFVAPAIVDEIIADPEKLRLGGHRRDITLLFTDLAGYTSISEQLPAEEVTELLNRHLSDMTEVVTRHTGTVNQFIGDAVMAIWGAPIDDPDQSVHALAAAIEMQNEVAAMRDELRAAGGPEIKMRVGIHRGECVVGNIGGRNRLVYSAVGDAVNLAARIEGVNKIYGTSILLSGSVAVHVQSQITLRPVDTVRVKGKQLPVDLFTPCSDPVLIKLTADALAAYRRGEWDAAYASWQALAANYPEDPLARVFVARLRAWSERGWPNGWDGVHVLDTK